MDPQSPRPDHFHRGQFVSLPTYDRCQLFVEARGSEASHGSCVNSEREV